MNKLKNYELIIEKQNAILSYDTKDSKVLQNIEDVFILASPCSNGNYNLLISGQDGEDLLLMQGLEDHLLKKLAHKKILIVGVNGETGGVDMVSNVLNLSIELKRKLKVA